MKKGLIFVGVLIFIFFGNIISLQAFCGGTGSTSDPYLICDWHDLEEVRNKPSLNYRLNQELNRDTPSYLKYNSGAGWVPIKSFSGTFDGNGYSISDLFINRVLEDSVGLFGKSSSPKKIFNLNLFNANVSGKNNVGILGGQFISSTSSIFNISVTGTVLGVDNVGGIVGYFGGNVENVSFFGSVQGEDSIGCFFGYFGGATSIILNSFSSCNINGNSRVGGFVGKMTGGKISNSHSFNSNVSGKTRIGGIIGDFYGNPGFLLDSSSFYSNVSGRQMVGGLIGSATIVSILNSHFSGDIYSISGYSGGLVGDMESGKVSNSSSVSNIIGPDYRIGGFIGDTFNVDISSSFSISEVSGTLPSNVGFRILGGFIGSSSGTNISNSYSISNVLGINNVGGFVGDLSGGNIFDSFSISKISASEPLGGLFRKSTGFSQNTFWDKEYSGIDKMCGSTGSCDNSFGKITSEMKSISTFSDWNICIGEEDLNSGYPYLAWQVGRDDCMWLIPSGQISSGQTCASIGGYCSPISIDNAEVIDGSCSNGLLCYSCNEGYKLDSGSCVEERVPCVSGYSSYWNLTSGEKEWTYNPDTDFSGDFVSCNKYSGFCCPQDSVCEENGKCVYDQSSSEICSSIQSEEFCNSNPEGYAKNEFELLLPESRPFGEDPCNSTWVCNYSLGLFQRKVCFCSWEGNSCNANRSVQYGASCDSGQDLRSGSPPSGGEEGDPLSKTDPSVGDVVSSSISTEFGECENGFQLVSQVNSLDSSCIQSSIPCIDEFPLPFFGLFNLFVALILVIIASSWWLVTNERRATSYKRLATSL